MTYTIENNTIEGRFETTVDGHTATLSYDIRDTSIVFTRTHVPEEIEGGDVGIALAERGIAFAKANDYKITTQCQFMQEYLNTDTGFEDVVGEREDQAVRRRQSPDG